MASYHFLWILLMNKAAYYVHLFITSVQIVAYLIWQTKQIKGMQEGKKEHNISLFVNDVALNGI